MIRSFLRDAAAAPLPAIILGVGLSLFGGAGALLCYAALYQLVPDNIFVLFGFEMTFCIAMLLVCGGLALLGWIAYAGYRGPQTQRASRQLPA